MYIVTEKDLIGDIEDYPIEVVQKMIERQYEQRGYCDIKVFQKNRIYAFCWDNTPERSLFWDQVVHLKNFDLFFDRYPKQEDLPLPRMVLVWDEYEDDAQERELLHILPDNLGLDYRYIVRGSYDTGYAIARKNIKELPTAKKMTKEEIEKELGYKIEIV